MSRFLVNFMSGMAKQYNANVAAGRAHEADIEKLDYEYGLRSAIAESQDAAAMLREQEQTSRELASKEYDRETKIKVQQEKGRQDRQTEKLKNNVAGTLDSVYSYAVPNSKDPDNPITRTLTIPFFKDAKGDDRIKRRAQWFDENGQAALDQLIADGQNDLANRFRIEAARAFTDRLTTPDNIVKDQYGTKTAYIDITSLYPGYASLLQDETINGIVMGFAPSLNDRLKQQAGYPASFEVKPEGITVNRDGTQAKGVSIDSPPDYFYDGAPSPETFREDLFKPVYQIKNVGRGDLDNFYQLAESVNPENPRTFVEKWVKIDNLYKPDINSDQFTPTIREEDRLAVAAELEPLRQVSVSADGRFVGGPNVLKDIFVDMAANDIIDTGNMLSISSLKTLDDATFAKATNGKGSGEFRSEEKASSRVVRLTKGVMISAAQGGQAGITGTLLLTLAGIKDQADAFLQIGDEILEVVGGMGYENEADRRAREQNFQAIRSVQKSIRSGNVGSVSATAMLRYYSTLLAYSMAVAVQGGDAAARTVSDQDVQRVSEGAAPAAAGSGRAVISSEELLTITANVRAEFGERAAIAGMYATKNPVQMRAAHYYNTTFKDRPMVFQDLVPNAVRVALAEAGMGLGTTAPVSTPQDSAQGSAALQFRARVNARSQQGSNNSQVPAPTPRPDINIEIEEPTNTQ